MAALQQIIRSCRTISSISGCVFEMQLPMSCAASSSFRTVVMALLQHWISREAAELTWAAHASLQSSKTSAELLSDDFLFTWTPDLPTRSSGRATESHSMRVTRCGSCDCGSAAVASGGAAPLQPPVPSVSAGMGSSSASARHSSMIWSKYQHVTVQC